MVRSNKSKSKNTSNTNFSEQTSKNENTNKATKTIGPPNEGITKSTTTIKSLDLSNSSSGAYKEINCLFSLFFATILATPGFNDEFDHNTFHCFQELIWICESALLEAQLIVFWVMDKANGLSKPLGSFTINLETDKFLCALRTKQVSQTFRAAIAIHTYTLREKCVFRPSASCSKTISVQSHS